MAITSFDPSGTLNLIFRKNRDGEKVFVFKNVDTTDYDISAIEFELRIKRNSNSVSNLILLTDGAGLATAGNELTVTITDTQSNQPSDFSYWELYNVTADETWINGNAYFITQSEDADNTVAVTINLAVEEVTVTVQNSGGGSIESQYRGAFIASDDTFPSTGGSGSGGSIMDGDEWRTTVSANYGGLSFPASTILKAIGNTPGQVIGNWRLI